MKLHSLRRTLIPASAFLLVTLFMAACEQSVDPQTPVDPTFASIQANVFAKSCATSSCHGTLGQRGGLILEGNDAYDNLVGAAASNVVAQAKGRLRVSPGKPDESFLITKLTTPGPGEGDRMPQGNNQLSAQAIEAIRTWISNGASR